MFFRWLEYTVKRISFLMEDRQQRKVLAALTFLSDGKAHYAADIFAASDGLLTEGNGYTILKRMAKDDLVVIRKESLGARYNPRALPRNLYKITKWGWGYLWAKRKTIL